MNQFLEELNFTSRDSGRTPMQWSDSTYAGFSSTDPWLPVNDNFDMINVRSEDADPESVLNHFRRMTGLRNENEVLVYGDYELLVPDHEQVYAYTRTLGDERMIVLLNFSAEPATVELSEIGELGVALINNYPELTSYATTVELLLWQAVVFR